MLYVKSMEQKILIIAELKGQLSDGWWENATPNDHWKVWCHLGWNDIQVGKVSGRTFGATKSNYNFTNPGYLQAVGDRMMNYIRAYYHIGLPVLKVIRDDHWMLPGSVADVNFYIAESKKYNSYYASRIQKLADYGIDLYDLRAAYLDLDCYNLPQLKADLKAIKVAFRTVINSKQMILHCTCKEGEGHELCDVCKAEEAKLHEDGI